jgi:hypothetical protein
MTGGVVMFAIANASQGLSFFQTTKAASIQRTPVAESMYVDDHVASSRPHSTTASQSASDTALIRAIASGDRRAMQML